MVVFGGDRGGKYLNDVWSYSLADNSWTQLQARRPPCSFGYMSSKSSSIGSKWLCIFFFLLVFHKLPQAHLQLGAAPHAGR